MIPAKMAPGHSSSLKKNTRTLHRSFSSEERSTKTPYLLYLPGKASGGHSEADDTVPLEDAGRLSPEWNTASTPRDIFTGPQAASPGIEDTEPTRRDIFSAVTSCNLLQPSALEGRMSTVEDDMAPMQRDLKYNCHLTVQNAARLNDLKNRMRRNNVRALVIPERAEGKKPVAFIEQWLLSTFGKDTFSPLFAVERAHRVPARPLPLGNHPRPVLFKLLNYKDRDVILTKARTMSGAMAIDNSKVPLFPDFSAELQKHHATFIDVK